mgnify:FL=1
MANPKDKKSKKDVVLNNNTIIVNPQLKEEASRKVVMSFGRMNPPTVGHEKLVNKVKEIARKEGAKAEIYLSHSQDAKKNPLSYDDKLMIAKEAFGVIVQKSAAKTIIEVMKSLDLKYDVITLVVGADRVNEFDTLLNKYNGREFNFDQIKVVSAGERDPDADGVEGMSASKMREAALKGEESKFKSGLPKKLAAHAEDIYTMVRAGMKLSEGVELDEYVLTVPQRQKRAIVMRRYERKMEAARERMRKRIADNQHLLGRARKKAIEIIRRKVAGDKGMEYQSLSPSEKIMIDKRVEQRKGAIAKIAARLLPKVRKAEMQRVALIQQKTAFKEDIDAMFEQYLDEGKRFHMAFGKDGKPKYDRRFRAFRHIVKEDNDAELLDIIAEMYDVAEQITIEEMKVIKALVEKADRAGIKFEEIYDVYEEGVMNGGNPFDHVNAYIAHMNEGVNDPSIFKAVFLAGGPGSGKSFIVGKTALTALGMKVINSDDIFERALAKAGLKTTPEDIYSEKGQSVRGEAKALTAKKQDLALNGRLGLVIDGTGKDYPKIEKQATKLKKLGYEVAMIFVNTDLETAKARNRARARSLPDAEVETMWKEVQKNIGAFQQFFGARMFIIDNSEGANFNSAVLSTYKKISAWAKSTPSNPAAKEWITSARTVKEDKMPFKHELGIKVPFKHIAQDALKHVDYDMDGDVDQDDFDKAVPDEATGTPDYTKKFIKKYKDELKHSKVGIAFEQVLAKPAPIIPPAPEDADTEKEVDAHVDRHLRAAETRAYKLKKLRAYHENYGAGFEGTDTLLQNYKAATPGEKGTPRKPKITDGINEAFEALMEAEGSVKKNRELYSTGRISKDEFDRRMGYGKYKKKGPAGVGPLGKTLYKNLVKSAVKEETVLMEADDPEITAAQMKEFEKFVDRMFEKYKIDFEFTKHFGERMNDDRNTPKIKLKELADLIKKIYNKHGNPLKDKPGAEMVVKDLQSDLNMPVVVKYDPKNDEIDIVAKTIMRKKNFSTPNPVIKY